MITEDLLAYIQAQLKKNISKATITSRLANAGWHASDIEEAFSKITPPSTPLPNTITQPSSSVETLSTSPVSLEKKAIDPYRELPDMDTVSTVSPVVSSPVPSIVLQTPVTPQIKEEPKIQTPVISPIQTPPQVTASAPVELKQTIPLSQSIPIAAAPIIPSIPVVQIQTAPLQPSIPSIAKTAEPVQVLPVEPKKEEHAEFMPTLTPKAVPIVPAPLPSNTPSASIAQVANIPSSPIESGTIPSSVQATPVAKPIATGVVLTPNSFAPAREPISQLAPKISTPVTTQTPTVDPATTLPKSAIIASYANDLSAANLAHEVVFQEKKRTVLKWLVIILAITVIGSGAYAYMEGLIKIPDLKKLKISLVKKDPKDILLSSASAFGDLASYKSETTASISSPSFANITSGLISGEAPTSKDMDSISVAIKGMTSKNNTASPFTDYLMTFKSSLLEKNIVIGLKHGGSTSYVTIPDTTELFGAKAPAPATVAVPDGKSDLILTELPPALSEKIRTFDTYKVLSKGISSSMEVELASIFKEFITSTTVIEKDPEDVRGIGSYHYQLTADRATTKKAFSHIVETFTTTLPEATKNNLEEALGSATLDAFDVWIGKDDGMIHQYSIAVTLPLSKVLGLDDKGIAGNVVKFNWKTTYYDFDVPNTISKPKTSIPITDFIKSIRDAKIKNMLLSFKAQAANFSHSAGNFGSRGNPNGSCLNPVASSLFSPVGHPKGANGPVGAIAGTMNTLLDSTAGGGSCYSTSGAWAIAAPLVSNPLAYFCVDSVGFSKQTSNVLAGTVCK